MNCKFCNQETEYSPTDSLGVRLPNEWEVRFCQNCNAFHYYVRGVLSDYEFIYEKYLVGFIIDLAGLKNNFEVYDRDNGDPIIELHFLPDITPSNFEKKFPTLKVFS